MFTPIDTIHTTHRIGKPKGWDDAKHGECVVLPTAVLDGEYHRSIISWWRPTFLERLKMLIGYNIRLDVVANQQPPVCIDIERVKEQK